MLAWLAWTGKILYRARFQKVMWKHCSRLIGRTELRHWISCTNPQFFNIQATIVTFSLFAGLLAEMATHKPMPTENCRHPLFGFDKRIQREWCVLRWRCCVVSHGPAARRGRPQSVWQTGLWCALTTLTRRKRTPAQRGQAPDNPSEPLTSHLLRPQASHTQTQTYQAHAQQHTHTHTDTNIPSPGTTEHTHTLAHSPQLFWLDFFSVQFLLPLLFQNKTTETMDIPVIWFWYPQYEYVSVFAGCGIIKPTINGSLCHSCYMIISIHWVSIKIH